MNNLLNIIEESISELVARVAPWLAPIPTAYLVGKATVEYLEWPLLIGITSAVIIEALGLATTSTALVFWTYNQSKRKADPAAPFALSAFLVVIYFLVATGLTIALDIWPELARYAPAIFPSLSLVGVTTLALRNDHKSRLRSVRISKAERSKKRSGSVRKPSKTEQKSVQIDVRDGNLEQINAGKKRRKSEYKEQMLNIYRNNPNTGATAVSKSLGIGRTTVYTYLEEMKAAGIIHVNGNGVEIL